MKGTTMRPAFRAPVITALAAAAALSLAGCGAMVSAAPSTSSPAASATASVSPSPSASAGGGAGGVATPGTSPAPAPAAADVKTYTFPDGHVSFKYPAGWKVELFTGSGSPSDSATATVVDASGTQQATVYSGRIADGVSHPVTRTVFESAPVPGLAAQPAPAAQYAFYVDRMDSNATYRMHLAAGAPKPGQGSALDGIIRAGDGVIVADVQFIEKPFANDAAAKSWLAGTEGQALKALLLSISYS
jgi:zona occludens toxin (predicted ATPase)